MAVLLAPPLVNPKTKPGIVDSSQLLLHSDSRQELFRMVWAQLHAAMLHQHGVVLLPPFSCDRKQAAPPTQVARVYCQVVETHFVGCFQELRFVVPHDLHHTVHAFEHAFTSCDTAVFRMDSTVATAHHSASFDSTTSSGRYGSLPWARGTPTNRAAPTTAAAPAASWGYAPPPVAAAGSGSVNGGGASPARASPSTAAAVQLLTLNKAAAGSGSGATAPTAAGSAAADDDLI